MNNLHIANTYYDNIKLLTKYKMINVNKDMIESKNEIKKLVKNLHTNNGILANLRLCKGCK